MFEMSSECYYCKEDSPKVRKKKNTSKFYMNDDKIAKFFEKRRNENIKNYYISFYLSHYNSTKQDDKDFELLLKLLMSRESKKLFNKYPHMFNMARVKSSTLHDFANRHRRLLATVDSSLVTEVKTYYSAAFIDLILANLKGDTVKISKIYKAFEEDTSGTKMSFAELYAITQLSEDVIEETPLSWLLELVKED